MFQLCRVPAGSHGGCFENRARAECRTIFVSGERAAYAAYLSVIRLLMSSNPLLLVEKNEQLHLIHRSNPRRSCANLFELRFLLDTE